MNGWLPILIYHRVCDEVPAQDPYRLCTSVARLGRAFRYLWEHDYRVVTLDVALELMTGDRPIGRYACITFDDGYREVYTHALRLLKRYGYPATVFVVTDYIGGTNRWDEALGLPSVPLLSRDEILEMADHGITFGGHGATHRRLTGLSLQEREQEILGSREALEALLGREVRFFAYPHIDQDPEIRQEVAKAGYRGACGGEQVTHEPYLLHRVDLSRSEGLAFLFRLHGWRHRLQSNRALRALKAAAPSPAGKSLVQRVRYSA